MYGDHVDTNRLEVGTGVGALTERCVDMRDWGASEKKKDRWPSAANASVHRSVYWNERLSSLVTNYVPTLFLAQPPSRPLVRLYLFLPSFIRAPDPVSHRSRLSFRILKFHESRRWFLMAVRYDAAPAVLLSVFLRPFFLLLLLLPRQQQGSPATPPFLHLPLTLLPSYPLPLHREGAWSTSGRSSRAALRYYRRPSSIFFSALSREAWSPLLIRYWSRDPRRLM